MDKERTISFYSEFFTDEELAKEYRKLAFYRNSLDAINYEINKLRSSDTDIEK